MGCAVTVPRKSKARAQGATHNHQLWRGMPQGKARGGFIAWLSLVRGHPGASRGGDLPPDPLGRAVIGAGCDRCRYRTTVTCARSKVRDHVAVGHHGLANLARRVWEDRRQNRGLLPPHRPLKCRVRCRAHQSGQVGQPLGSGGFCRGVLALWPLGPAEAFVLWGEVCERAALRPNRHGLTCLGRAARTAPVAP